MRSACCLRVFTLFQLPNVIDHYETSHKGNAISGHPYLLFRNFL